ncbi:CoA pyrophosphatase [Ammoniphilus sp. CFH 90114]|uniref:NUDIX hydrolase n=1 Tax=Ammoniphilus sp. CFH 90114 TaxID=2493665 RepID=UPI00100F5B90|nr:CoA pyrophosphatase [Ammoniphilus sp. CFH 90114]RXT05692.1 CoA pyrophosphatase [Ammoniphilus sp. CFH 90114]
MIEEIKAIYRNRTPHILGHESVAKAAVMVPLIQNKDGLSVLFQVRGHQLRRQPGEICFPGGRLEPDDLSEESAAIRETCEELGIGADEIDLIAPLDIFVTTHTILYPYLCQLKDDIHLYPDPEEVAEVFTVPLKFLMNYEPELYYIPLEMKPPEDFPFELIPNGKSYKWRKAKIAEYFYRYEDKVIWGMTARILHDFVERMKREENLDGA